MSDFACWECKNLSDFVQVSARGDARDVTMTHKSGLSTGNWSRPDDRAPGIYCAQCSQPLPIDASDYDLVDTRIDFVAPDEFRAEEFAEEVMRLRPDATWSRLQLPARPAVTADLDARVHPAIADALARIGRLPLYSHQAEAITAALDGEHVVQATSAGSGKSLGFVVPVLDALLANSGATAILVFPLKALANDQMANLARLSMVADPWVDDVSLDVDLGHGGRPIRVARYDGSTPEHLKPSIRRHARLLIATPDVIHSSVLRMATTHYKDKSSWDRLLGGLRYVVLDEIHSYQGVFGSNVAQVLRRLRRAAAWHGARPQLLAASATIGNPVDLAERLTGVAPFRLVDNDGAPQRGRTVLVCNPPIATEQTAKKRRTQKERADEERDGGRRLAPQTVALEVVAAAALSSADHPPVRTICFGRSRNEVFALTKRIQSRLQDVGRAELVPMVASYAATLLTDDRLDAEGSLRDGSLLAVVSTNALELGIDIPDLSLAVLCGYPGQISAFRQRAGRCGRAGEGLVVLVVGDDPLQQHLASHPEALQALLNAKAEDVIVNPDAPEVLRRYGLVPAEQDLGGMAYEDAQWFGKEAVDEWLARAVGSPTVVHDGVAYWRVEPEPDDVHDLYLNIRSAGTQEQYFVVAGTGPNREPIGTIDSATGPRDAFPGAIWSGPKGNLYRVVSVDHRAREVRCDGPVAVNYLTRGVPIDAVTVGHVIDERQDDTGNRLVFADLQIRRNVFSYKELHFSGAEYNRTIEGAKWPEQTFSTQGVRIDLPPVDLPDGKGAVRAVEHVLLALAPVVVACDPYDLDATSDATRIYLYESFGGGIGTSRPVYDRFSEVAALAYETVATCPCTDGCPGCIVLGRRPEGNRDLSKTGALALLATIAGVERDSAQGTETRHRAP